MGGESYGGSGPPVVLVHGTNDTSATLRPLADRLRADGRQVIVPEYGQSPRSLRGRSGSGGLGPLARSQAEILEVVRGVLARRAAPYVDLIGHSQGGLHVLGCAAAMPDRVGHAVLLGTPLYGVRPLGRVGRVARFRGVRRALDAVLGPSAGDMLAGSAALPDPAALPAGPRYLLIASRSDSLVRPAYLARAGADDRLRVEWVQDIEPRRRVSHVDLVSDALVYHLVVEELAAPLAR